MISSAIYFLLQAGEVSHWHTVDSVEIWHIYAGDPLQISIKAAGQGAAARGARTQQTRSVRTSLSLHGRQRDTVEPEN
jgi:predicted cupin superfamily sugar epimerase